MSNDDNLVVMSGRDMLMFWLGVVFLALVYGTFSALVLMPHHVHFVFRFLGGFVLGIAYSQLYRKYVVGKSQ
jgi:hypothetical protein